jgi:dTDP-4-dehydrorhamnose 3,5-epimerase
MRVINTELLGVKIIEPQVFCDNRGIFFESFRKDSYKELGIPLAFVQDNISRSKYGVLRGLHFQLKYPQGKLVTVTYGEVFDVVVDIRVGSVTFGKWLSVILNDKNHKQIYIPPGFAHGFCVLSEFADFHYKCTNYYSPKNECGIIWNDPNIGIKWPKMKHGPILSDKDKSYKSLSDMELNKLVF